VTADRVHAAQCTRSFQVPPNIQVVVAPNRSEVESTAILLIFVLHAQGLRHNLLGIHLTILACKVASCVRESLYIHIQILVHVLCDVLQRSFLSLLFLEDQLVGQRLRQRILLQFYVVVVAVAS
jgi:hypothetical protein